MGSMLTLTASDHVTIGAYKAEPIGTPRGAIVVLQEIFGVNPHIRRVTDSYAEQGYVAIAPALFDRVKPGIELGYTPEDVQKGVATQQQTVPADTLKDIEAAIAEVASVGKVGVVGYCWGGTLAFVSTCRLDGVTAAVGYYGGNIASMLDLKPRVPLMLHFGEKDDHISADDVARIKAALPDVPVFTYPAGHGFNCDARGSYDKPSADLALSRTLPFFRQHIG